MDKQPAFRLHITSVFYLPFLLLLTEIFFSSCRWKTHKWRRCQLVPWSIQQSVPGAQEGCGPGRQARGGRLHTRVDLLSTSSYFILYLPHH